MHRHFFVVLAGDWIACTVCALFEHLGFLLERLGFRHRNLPIPGGQLYNSASGHWGLTIKHHRGFPVIEVRLEYDIQWDGKASAIWVIGGNRRVLCKIPRETIHKISTFNDIISREILRTGRKLSNVCRSRFIQSRTDRRQTRPAHGL
jgi:hypothetical protein